MYYATIRLILAVFLSSFILHSSSFVQAQTHFVRLNSTNPVPPYTSWETAATNIQDAIDVATNGALVLVSNGVYQTGGRKIGTQSLTNRVAITNLITVQSVNGPAVTTIKGAWDPSTTNGNAAVRGVQFTAAGALIGFTVTNGATLGTNAVQQIDRRGGGILGVAGSVVSNCVITGNSASQSGGGVQGGMIYRSTLRGNRAPDGGGAMFSSPEGALFECVVEANTATFGGGGVRDGEVHNSFVGKNTAGGDGGGARDALLVNCTVVSNSSSTGIGGLYKCSAVNSIVYFNSSSNYDDTVTFTNSCSTPLPPGPGNIADDPKFLGGFNFRLRFESPAIDQGDKEALVSLRDLDGKPRVLNGLVDMGAYEFGDAPTSAVTTNTVLLGFTSAELNGSVSGGGLPASAFFVYQRASSFSSTNETPIDIPDLTNAVPYPSSIAVSGITGIVNEVQVSLDGLTHSFVSDLDILLVGPQGQAIKLLSDAGGTASLYEKRLIFTDRSPVLFTSLNSGFTYFRPTDPIGADVFPPPAPTNQIVNNLSVFAGTDPNGTWSLFMVDDSSDDTGSLNGWSLTFGQDEVWATAPQSLPESTNSAVVSAVVTGLTVDSEYLFRIEATNEVGRTTGVDVLFRTPGPPDAETLAARVTGPYSAVLRGEVTPNLANATAWFEYGPTTNYGFISSPFTVDATNITATIEFPISLPSDAEVHFRVAASNSLGLAVSADRVVVARRTHFVDLHNATPSAPFLTWATAATNIQDALDVADDRALVLVSNGVYETGSRLTVGLLPNRVAITNVVTVQSVNGPTGTIIRGAWDPVSTNGPGAVRGAFVVSNAVLAGFTLTGGATFTNGTASEDFEGGGVYQELGGALSNCIVVGNHAAEFGGGVYGGNVYSCLVESNQARVGGGLAMPNNSDVIARSIVRNNRASFDATGGGIAQGRAIDCLIYGNTAGVGGGVAYTELIGCTVAENTALQAGGAYGSKVFNSIIYFNSALTDENYTLDVFFGRTNFVHTCTTPEVPGPNNITDDPRFVSIATGDFRLRTNSPCRNTGVNTSVVSSADVVGNPRIREGVVDMGALEYQPLPESVTLSPIFTPTGVVVRGEVNPGEVVTSWYIEWDPFFETGAVTLTNQEVITINDLATAAPYPSTLQVSGLTGEVLAVVITLESLSHTRPTDIDMLLQGPHGEAVRPMSDVGNGTDVEAARLVFDDRTTNKLSTTDITSGTYQPSNIGSADSFPAPAITSKMGTNLAVFAGTNPNGTWSLFVVDDLANDVGAITGWSMRVSVSDPSVVVAGGTLDATNSFIPVSGMVTGLVAGQTFRYRVVASNTGGVVTSEYVTLNVPVLTTYVAIESTNPTPPFATWATAATNIQDAVDAVVTGGMVCVSNGVYRTGGRVALGGMLTNRLAITNGITVRAVNGPEVTVIEGAKSASGIGFGLDAVRGVYIADGGRLEGFSVRGGSTDQNLNPDGLGGGVRITAGTVSGCIILSNQALRGGGVYGGVVLNSLIVSNFAIGVAGGAMEAQLFNCTVVENQGFETVGGVVGGLVVNAIVVDNRTFTSTNVLNWQSDAGPPVFNHSLTAPLPPGSGNTDAAPLFVNATAGNYRLQPGSSGVNAGTNEFVFGATDLDGNPRILGGRVDFGAYETAGADADGDGSSDLEEYIADTVPTNGVSFFRPLALTNAPPGQFGLVIAPTSTGRVYFVETSTNLLASPQVWTLIPPERPGNSGSLTITVTNDLPMRHYRTGVRLP